MMYTARSFGSSVGSCASTMVTTFPSADTQSAARRLLLFVLELLQQAFLFAGQLLRNIDPHRDEQVAVPAPLRCPLALHAERLARGRSRRELELHRPVQRWDVDRRSEGRLGVGDGELDREVVALASEHGVSSHANLHVEIARLPSRGTRLASTCQADPRPVLHAGRDLDLELPRAPLSAGAV